METLKLGAKPLTLEDIHDVAVSGRKVALSPAAVKKIKRANAFLLSEIAKGKTLYGVNTGFGLLSDVKIPEAEIETLQYNLLRSHACGMGPYLSDEYARAMVLLRASTLAIGHSGVSLRLVEHILAVLNRGICPMIPEQGSVGASGDLAPLSHLALVLIGEGRARVKGREMTGAQALRSAGLKPIRLGPKEGLALINGTQFMAAIGSLSVLEAEHLCDVADALGAMTVEAMKGTSAAFDAEIHAIRPHPGQILSAKHMRRLLADSKIPGSLKSEIARSHENCGKVQDPYSLRCIPQVHGASRDAIAHVRMILEREINSVTDNPLVFPASKKILSGGNFHGQYVSIGMDLLSIAAAELASISEQRLEKLINPAISGLPAFLTPKGGINSGFMIVQVAAASIVSENKTLCHPASVDTIPTSADKEDHVSMGAWAARKAARVITNTRRVLAMELLAASQGIDFLRPLRSSPVIEKIHGHVRKKIRRLEVDRSFHEDLKYLESMIASRELESLLRSCYEG
ncbi:MAG: histidine ammonia-lyase [Bdellovibrionales bacterium RIFOXYD1_FULL_55_31]|nr:MAG: histidine ammonia-lyase [Bdellovibrionales bacterium RIFOXYD1_FULL_55_31]